VVFIEDDEPYTFKRGVFLQAPGEDPLGHYLDAGTRPYFALQPNPVSNGLTYPLIQLAGQTLRCSSSSKAAGLKHQDGLVTQPWLIEESYRDSGGFAGAWWSLKNSFISLCQGGAKLWKRIIDWKTSHS